MKIFSEMSTENKIGPKKSSKDSSKYLYWLSKVFLLLSDAI